tara:strand:+ start:283 stop:747 length:465 start_codon:yes stop_codon:yes gene_type:complete
MDRWKAGDEIQENIKTLIGEAHPHLADICDDIICIFKEKASRKGGQPVLGKTSKAPALISLLGERDYQFVIELAADTWNLLEEDQRKSLLDHQLCFIGGEEDDKSGEMKYFMTAPDISYFSSEVERNGHWRPDLSESDEEEESTESQNLSLEDL